MSKYIELQTRYLIIFQDRIIKKPKCLINQTDQNVKISQIYKCQNFKKKTFKLQVDHQKWKKIKVSNFKNLF